MNDAKQNVGPESRDATAERMAEVEDWLVRAGRLVGRTDRLQDVTDRVRDDVRWLLDALREARRDTQRLDWLEQCDGLNGYDDIGSTIIWYVRRDDPSRTVREAIDAASSPSGTTPEETDTND